MQEQDDVKRRVRTLSARYEDFAARFVPPDASSMDRRHMMRAYFAGADSMLEMVLLLSEARAHEQVSEADYLAGVERFGTELEVVHRMQDVEELLHNAVFIRL